jgi:hypothetical protein
MTALSIGRRFQGIPGIAHGGYAAGLLAEHLGDGPVEVTLRRPPPLDTTLDLRADGETFILRDQAGRDVLQAEPVTTSIEPPPTVDPLLAMEVQPLDRFRRHPYPVCFVCGVGPQSTELRVGAVGDGVVAGAWQLDPRFGDSPVRALLWAAFDCVQAWAFAVRWDEPGWWPAVTARLTVDVRRLPEPDRRYAIVGWLRARTGRRIEVCSYLLQPDGQVTAAARGRWVHVPRVPRPEPLPGS